MVRDVLLVVDDDQDTSELLNRTLGSRYQVLSVSHGKRALELVSRGGVDLAFVSSCLPDMDGLELLMTLRTRYPSLPVVFASVAPTASLILSTFRAGVADFLEKPLDREALLACVRRTLSGRMLSAAHPFSEMRVAAPGTFSRLQRLAQHAQQAAARLLERALGRLTSKPATAFPLIALNHPAERPPAFPIQTTPDGRPMIDEAYPSDRVQRGLGQRLELSAPSLVVSCLGEFRVVVNDTVISQWPSRKGRALFAYLAMNHNKRTYRDVLMDKFWPTSSPDSARNCLNVTVHGVRRCLQQVAPGYDFILFKDECYFLNPEIDVWLDVEEFVKHWRVAQSTERQKGIGAALAEYELAASLYSRDFMEEERYSDWPIQEREHLREIYLVILDRLSRHYSLDGKAETAISLCERILEKDSCREDVHRRLMKCYLSLGYRDKALRQFQKCAEALQSELEVDPTRATLELYQEIKSWQVREADV